MPVVHAQKRVPLKVASYNIRYENHNDVKAGNGWQGRLPVIVDLLTWESPDIFGAQEVLEGQYEDLKRQLPAYAAYGIGRADGKTAGEYAPIFYKKDRFEVVDQGTFWLSETPQKPSKGWDAVLPRICSWVKLKLRDNHKVIWAFNAHYDHVGVKARANSSQLILDKIEEMTQGEPTVLMGDFNVDQHHRAYQIIEASDLMDDSFVNAEHRMAHNGTFNGFHTEQWTSGRIDHIFTSPNIEVSHYALLTPVYWRVDEKALTVEPGHFPKEVSAKEAHLHMASDHFPIMARLQVAFE